MSNKKTNEPASGRAETLRSGDWMTYVEGILVVGWVLVPALQYFASHQRMLLIMQRHAPFEWLALLDLTPVYALLLASTVLCFVLRILRDREARSGR